MIINTISAMVRRQAARGSSSAAALSSRTFSTAPQSTSNYVSPYNDLFEMMKSNNASKITVVAPSETDVPMLKCGIPETVLKFKTTCYDRLQLAPYVQPNEYKVILQVKMHHLPLESDIEKEIFHQIVGTRFDHELGELKLTSNQFASRIENKRHLCWMLDRIVLGAKKLAAESN
ncbi:hypothetical protein CTEN210_02055 [Chaetoceros tenuissimus]|uniref:Small ribosomal subunit protein mS35 mitochondrial conserved domain-containing protein n=1 Tax=Chaetoceros tenuissimus TaxID=426638 RepID=A0AAD3CGV0_9STRA|nr:hypothetical protein CTEN210_02055 [Chaetoceros tenuissimus]